MQNRQRQQQVASQTQQLKLNQDQLFMKGGQVSSSGYGQQAVSPSTQAQSKGKTRSHSSSNNQTIQANSFTPGMQKTNNYLAQIDTQKQMIAQGKVGVNAQYSGVIQTPKQKRDSEGNNDQLAQ